MPWQLGAALGNDLVLVLGGSLGSLSLLSAISGPCPAKDPCIRRVARPEAIAGQDMVLVGMRAREANLSTAAFFVAGAASLRHRCRKRRPRHSTTARSFPISRCVPSRGRPVPSRHRTPPAASGGAPGTISPSRPASVVAMRLRLALAVVIRDEIHASANASAGQDDVVGSAAVTALVGFILKRPVAGSVPSSLQDLVRNHQRIDAALGEEPA